MQVVGESACIVILVMIIKDTQVDFVLDQVTNSVLKDSRLELLFKINDRHDVLDDIARLEARHKYCQQDYHVDIISEGR